MAHLEDPMELLRMVRVLADIGFRDLKPAANCERLAVSRRLHKEGVTDRTLELLWKYAQEVDKLGSPAKLFSWWLNRPSRTLYKLQEMRRKSVWLKRQIDAMDQAATAAEKAGTILPMRREAE